MNTVAKISGALFGVVAIYWAYTGLAKGTKKEEPSFKETAEIASKVVTAIAAKKVAEALSEPKVEARDTTPAKPELLPDGEFYTLARISKITDTGIKGIGAGEKVNKIREENGFIIVSNGKVELPAKPDQLTNLKSYGTRLAMESEIPKVEEKKPEPAQPESMDEPKPAGPHPYIKIYEKQIAERRKEIEELEDKMARSTSKTKAQQPIITRLRLEIEKLEEKKRALEK
jgi:vacuolar-type H+-ATPase subunit I/STV1